MRRHRGLRGHMCDDLKERNTEFYPQDEKKNPRIHMEVTN